MGAAISIPLGNQWRGQNTWWPGEEGSGGKGEDIDTGRVSGSLGLWGPHGEGVSPDRLCRGQQGLFSHRSVTAQAGTP